MANDTTYADLLEDSMSPLTAAGIDPDEARQNRAAALAKLRGADDDDALAPTAGQGSSQNGNPLPPGLNRRVPPANANAADTLATPVVGGGAAPSSVTPGGTPSLADSNSSTIRLMQADYGRASQDVANMAAQPDQATATRGLENQVASANARAAELANPYDKQTGKLLDEYKPSFGQRLMRGVEGFARGGVLGVVDPEVGGGQAYGAPSKEYGREVNQQNMVVAGANQRLQNAQANWKATSDRLGKVASERRSLATMGKDVTGANTAQQKIPIDQQNADTRTAEAANNTPEAKARGKAAESESEFQQNLTHGRQMGLTGTQLTLYAANGKIPEPRQATGEEIAAAQANNAFVRENGRQPKTLAEFSQIRAAARGNLDSGDGDGGGDPKQAGHDAQAQAIVADQVAKKQQFADGYRRSSDGRRYISDDGKSLTAQQFQDKIEQFRVDGNTKLARHGWQVDASGNMVRTGAKASTRSAAPQTPTPTQQQAAVARPTPQTHPVGSAVSVGGRPMVITGYNTQTGKAIVAPPPAGTGQ